MNIRLFPQVRDASVAVERTGDVLRIGPEVWDFSPLPSGATLPARAIESDYIIGDVERNTDGVLHVHVIFPIGPHAGEVARFPQPIVNPPDGPVHLPDPGFEELE